jgi:hypothetical protein
MATPSIQGLFGGMGTPEEMQRQLVEQKATQFAGMSPQQQLSYNIYKGTGNLGRGLAGAFGVDVQDPAIKRATMLRQMASQFDTNTVEGLKQMAAALQGTDPELGFQVMQRAQAMEMSEAKLGSEKALITQREREKVAADPYQQFLRSAVGKVTPASLKKFKDSEDPNDLEWVDKPNLTEIEKLQKYRDSLPAGSAARAEVDAKIKPESKQATSEFERLVDSLNISDEKKQSMKAQRATSMMAGDSSGLKAITAELAQARLDALKLDTRQKEDKANDEKRMAIEKLSNVESSVDTTLSTAERALKLAPGTMLQATNQALFNNIPFSDAKSMKNLVSSLNSEKALQALEQLKAQSRTGATGFGALTAPELQLIIDKTRSLDPTDKMFRENLGIIMDGWRKIKNSSMDSRINLQGKGDKLSSLKSKVAAVKARGSMTAQEKAEIDALKAELGVN